MLICNQQLTQTQLADLANLIATCQTHDGGVPMIYHELLAQKRDSASNVLYYHQNQLQGFVSAYYFYQDACELSLLVAPTLRRQKIATQLLTALLPLLQAKGMMRLIFSTAPALNDNWLLPRGLHKQQSDYHMERERYEPILISNPRLTVRKATFADMLRLCALDEACFDVPQVNMIDRFSYLLDNHEYTILIAYKNETIVGKAHIRWLADEALFSDIAILPIFQRQGLGSELLALCINQALSLGRIKLALDVEARNQSALNLYLRHGFKIITTHDYWSITWQTLNAWLLK